MHDRGMIKWLPFDSVINSQKTLEEIINSKSKISMPFLSEEQINILEQKIIIAFNRCENITVKYYSNGHFFILNDKIKKIDSINHKIYFSSKILIFEQIIDITSQL